MKGMCVHQGVWRGHTLLLLARGCGYVWGKNARPRVCGHNVLLPTDVDIVECLQRPYEVKTHALAVPSVGREVGRAYSGISPSLGTASLWTAQATNRIPGHTGYIITATLHCKSVTALQQY